MIYKNIFKDLESAYSSQSKIFYGESINLSNFKKTYSEACEKYIFCLSKKNLKHFPEYLIRHSDEYCSFLLFLARQAYLAGDIELAICSYLINRRMNSFDCFYTRVIPDIFHLEHPIGSVIGNSELKNFLIIYQGVTIGSNLKSEAPSIDEKVVLFPNSTVIGSTKIGKNCAIGAGVQIYNEIIQDNSSVSFRKSGNMINSLKWSVRNKYFSC